MCDDLQTKGKKNKRTTGAHDSAEAAKKPIDRFEREGWYPAPSTKLPLTTGASVTYFQNAHTRARASV